MYFGIYAVSEKPYAEGEITRFIWDVCLNRHVE